MANASANAPTFSFIVCLHLKVIRTNLSWPIVGSRKHSAEWCYALPEKDPLALAVLYGLAWLNVREDYRKKSPARESRSSRGWSV